MTTNLANLGFRIGAQTAMKMASGAPVAVSSHPSPGEAIAEVLPKANSTVEEELPGVERVEVPGLKRLSPVGKGLAGIAYRTGWSVSHPIKFFQDLYRGNDGNYSEDVRDTNQKIQSWNKLVDGREAEEKKLAKAQAGKTNRDGTPVFNSKFNPPPAEPKPTEPAPAAPEAPKPEETPKPQGGAKPTPEQELPFTNFLTTPLGGVTGNAFGDAIRTPVGLALGAGGAFALYNMIMNRRRARRRSSDWDDDDD